MRAHVLVAKKIGHGHGSCTYIGSMSFRLPRNIDVQLPIKGTIQESYRILIQGLLGCI